jgi:arylsulfatase A-like enzyme
MAKWFGRVFLISLVFAALCGTAVPARAVAGAPPRPNIVFVLTDDLADNLVTPQFTPNLWSLMHQGTSFSNYFVADSLCCPSRASIFTGRFPHDTGVYANSGSEGGYPAFNSHGDETSTVATDLHAAGYRTAMMGKYLNEYRTSDPPAPGWDVWDVADWGYPEFNYSLNENGRVVHYGGPNQPGHDNYLTDVLSSLGDSFITGTVKDHPSQPFFLELATFAPHNPFTPAPKYANLYPGLQAPKTPAFDAGAINPPAWLGQRKPLSAEQLALVNKQFRMRAQSMRSVDDMIGKLVGTLQATGELRDTYFVFSSDNGLHMGDHRLMPGKLTAFDTDTNVPLIVVGPGVRRGHQATSFAQNIDLRSTFDAFARTKPSEVVDGRSLAPLLSTTSRTNRPPKDWPQGALIEHLGPVDNKQDPDYQNEQNANPPSYEALRLPGALYVEYSYGFREYYNLTKDPYELDNVYGSLSGAQKTALHDELAKAERCHNAKACAAPFVVSS